MFCGSRVGKLTVELVVIAIPALGPGMGVVGFMLDRYQADSILDWSNRPASVSQ